MQEFHHPSGEVLREFYDAAKKDLMDKRAKVMEAKGYEVRNRRKIGRNEPCPCQSGLKFKKCCIRLVQR